MKIFNQIVRMITKKQNPSLLEMSSEIDFEDLLLEKTTGGSMNRLNTESLQASEIAHLIMPLCLFLRQRENHYEVVEDGFSISLSDKKHHVFIIYYDKATQQLVVEKDAKDFLSFGRNAINSQEGFFRTLDEAIPEIPPHLKEAV